MSKIGKKVIKLIDNTVVQIQEEANQVTINGKHGSISKTFLNIVSFEVNNNEIIVKLKDSTKFGRSYYGLARNLLQNMVIGVSQKFSKSLLLEGVGYKFQIEKNFLIANIGFTHSVKFEIPENLSVLLISPTKITISGINKDQVGLYASKIRSLRPPEPYKGKGIMYEKEIIRRKVGKTGR